MLTRARAKAAASVAPWSELLPEVVQRIAGFLYDTHRAAMLRACTAWCAAIQAVPALWPETVLNGQAPDYYAWEFESAIEMDDLQHVVLDAKAANKQLLQRAAALDRLTWRVRVAGCYNQPGLAPALLALLPPTVRQLRLDVECCEPLFVLLRRFPQLESLSISGQSGNGAQLDWCSRAAARFIPMLTALRLDFRGDPQWSSELVMLTNAPIELVPESLPAAMAAATRLTSLELLVEWSDEVSELWAALPALVDLRLTLYECTDDEAADAVFALEHLPRLRSLELAIISAWSGSNSHPFVYLNVDDWGDFVNLPPLAQLAGCLTSLTLAGVVGLPPDWRQLRALQKLRVYNEAWWEEEQDFDDDEWSGLSWGSGSLSSLTSLTSLQLFGDAVLPDPADVATAPNLAHVVAPRSVHGVHDEWYRKLKSTRPGVDVRML